MKVMDLAETEKNANKRSFAIPGLSKASPESQAQAALVGGLERSLDNSYFLLRNVHLKTAEQVVPVILIGPPGMWVIYPSPARGIYKAEEETWEQLNERRKDYAAARPNLLTLTQSLLQGVQADMEAAGIALEGGSEAVLYFSNSGAHVDATRPAVRIVLSDALDRFALGLVQSPIILEADDVRTLVDLFSKVSVSAAVAAAADTGNVRDSFSFQDEPEIKPKRSLPWTNSDRHLIDSDKVAQRMSAPLKRFRFSRQQWIILGVLMAANILLLIVVVFVLLIG